MSFTNGQIVFSSQNLALTIFIIASIVNVVLSTIKTIIMYDKKKWSSALASGVYFGFYTVILVLMNCSLSLGAKIVITALANIVGVWLGMMVVEKMSKDKLWVVTATVTDDTIAEKIAIELHDNGIGFNITRTSAMDSVNKIERVFSIYLKTKHETNIVKPLLKKDGVHYCVHECGIRL